MSRKHNPGIPFMIRVSPGKLPKVSIGGTIEIEGSKRKITSIKAVQALSNGLIEIKGIIKEEKEK
jgi:hypothetical protein